ncbi:SurA N-terminal domain-containing protein [Acuticoccus sp. MNP-M23]|uniref:peptidylprolyl isomerase n=1 Tax=Acuticoccus sp. MNP-M23 TaxID=3072793 RepID=UPI002815EA54|nr:SurA N-terminal domain-containing protein [Acuticoccus sp. MNP-M23]WMS41316.1 SurA N-terminal domain-containing protein [Acuticoccus sp. MNP-M23]
MLNALRRGAKTIFAKILIGLLVLSFAVWGIADFVNQIDPTEVARAGETPVSAAEYSRRYQRAMNAMAQQTGQGLTPQQAQAFGLPNQVLSQLVTEALQVDAARALGVDIGDEMLAERIREDEAFAGSNGEFSRARFDQLLGSNRYMEAEYLEVERAAAAQDILIGSLVGGLKVPEPYLQAYNRYQNQTRTVRYITLTDDALGPIEDPTQAALQTYYDANKADFRAPEYRGLSMVTLSPEALAEPDAVSAEAVRRAYDANGAYGEPEQRAVQQIILDDPEIAQKAVDALNNGAAFSAVLRELGRTFAEVDLGTVARSDLVDPAVADAAFSLDRKGAAVVDGRFGPTLVRVSEIVAAGKTPLEQVEAEIRTELALDEARDQIRALYNSVEDAVAGGARVAEIAERFSLPTRSVASVDAQGRAADGTYPDPRVDEAVLSAGFAAAEGDDAEPVTVGDGYTWVQVDTVTPAADRPFADVEGDVLVAWTRAEKVNRLADIAAKALAAVEGGTPMDEVAATYGATAETAGEISRGAPAAAMPQQAIAAAFEGPLGHTASVIAEDGSHVVLKVTEVSEPAFFANAADLQNVRTTLNDGIAEGLIFELVNARQGEVGATVNQPVLNQIIGLEQGS